MDTDRRRGACSWSPKPPVSVILQAARTYDAGFWPAGGVVQSRTVVEARFWRRIHLVITWCRPRGELITSRDLDLCVPAPSNALVAVGFTTMRRSAPRKACADLSSDIAVHLLQPGGLAVARHRPV